MEKPKCCNCGKEEGLSKIDFFEQRFYSETRYRCEACEWDYYDRMDEADDIERYYGSWAYLFQEEIF